MTKFSDEQRQAILSEAYAHAAGTDDVGEENSSAKYCVDATFGETEAAQISKRADPLENWARSMPRAEPRRRVRGLDTTPVPPIEQIRQMVRAEVEAEREFMREAVAEAMMEKLAEERQTAGLELGDEVKRLRLEVTQLESAISDLRHTLAEERRAVLDDPVRAPRQRVQ